MAGKKQCKVSTMFRHLSWNMFLFYFVNREIVRSKTTTINLVFVYISLFRFDDRSGYIQDLTYSQNINKRHEC